MFLVAHAEDFDWAGCPEHIFPFVAGDVEKAVFGVQRYSARQTLLVVDYREISELLEREAECHDSSVAHVDDEDAASLWINAEVTGIV